MKKFVQASYIICMAGLILLFCVMAAKMKDDVFQKRQETGYQYLTDYDSRLITDDAAPLGVKTEYLLYLDELPEGSSTLMFYTIHQSVEVSIDGELIYSVHPDEDNLFGKTPGNNWNSIPIYGTDRGKEFRIVLIPAYESSVDIVPQFYLGSGLSIWIHLISRNIFAFFLSLITICIGIIFLLFTLSTYRNAEVNKSLLLMGLFSFNIGLWKLADLDSTALIFPYSIPLSYVPFITLLLVVIPFVLYVKELFSRKESILWYLPCFASIAVIVVSTVLQIADVADFRQLLWLNHAVMCLLVVLVPGMIVHELRTVGWNPRLKLTMVCMISCLAGLIADILIYYISKGTSVTVLGMLGFMVYIIVLGISSFHDARKLMEIGVKAKHFRQIAYHDQLTGLYNRTAYAEYTTLAGFNPENCILVMFDLNNLKQCNDTSGHDKGDLYITASARLIEQNFGDIGNCYRMGGDEFCALLPDVRTELCTERLKKLKAEVRTYNRQHPDDFPIGIACGFERYDKELDYDISDTLRRADKMMYHEKFLMKHPASAR
ncbi:MAG: GGDEF domain-containing protein [Roseburia sp.]|nr:GGDEF domain-containing protein [Roseburia sp.]